LVRKSIRALKSARLALGDKDYDNAVNRAYYSMFDIARAALLRANLAEDQLPRTHNGVNEAFYRYAVQSGQIDRKLAADLGGTESLRIRADYTEAQIDRDTATEAVAKAEIFVQTVERVFGLDESSLASEYENHPANPDNKISEPAMTSAKETPHGRMSPLSLEEERRQARENWLRLRQRTIKGASPEAAAPRETGKDASRSADLDLDE
jgi:uncharacterized protein (UPF0332 family)